LRSPPRECAWTDYEDQYVVIFLFGDMENRGVEEVLDSIE
jgi:hypothetical protein